MNEHIKTFIAKCDICRSVDVKQQKETLHPHEVPSRPWARGIPDVVVSDNGPQYNSQEFQRFCQLWEFQHRTSSPGYPQSNGKAESAVKTAKRLMRKAKAAGEDPYLSMLDHRNTPTEGLKTSPAQRLLCRRTRTLLPTRDSLLQPEVKQTTRELIDRQRRQAKYFNRTAKDMDTLKRGDRVRIQPFDPHTVWRKATVVNPVDHRSYAVQLDTGGVLRRNRRHLRRDQGTAPSVANHTVTEETHTTPETVATPDRVVGDTQQTVTTKSGRAVVRPGYLKDYAG
ncbi:hypothetical protein PBY51_020693 [Eleginops maclovinus]|uniref:Integrase catalytic domain-containing protein n=1 Tax=Eleginops maclovinus TaxID=56733 RepID=A0AAN7XMD7_ELEMC|nr:hypothetical protein PBY51_020693 [Eleginops maclovinus]